MLRNIFIAAFIGLIVFQASAQEKGIQFVHTFEEAQKASKETGKIIFVDAFTTWCGPCKRMSSEVFTDKEVGSFFNSNFINLKLDMEKGEGPKISQKYSVTAYPTFLFIDSEGKLVHKDMGYRVAEQFITLGKAALKSGDKSGDIKKKIDAGDRSPAILRKYAYALLQGGQDYQKAANEYLKTQKDSLNTEQNILFYYDFGNYADSKVFDLMLSHKEAIIKNKGLGVLQGKIEIACKNTVKRAAEVKSEDLLKTAKKIMKSNVGGQEAKKFEVESDMLFYNGINAAKYLEACDKYAGSVISKDARKLFDLAYQVYQNHKAEAKTLSYTTKWAEKAYSLEKKYEYTFLLAQLYFKANNKKKALPLAEESVKLATNENISPDLAKQLIEKIKK